MLSLPHRAFEHGILAAISGGADSTALLHLLVQTASPHGKLAVAHVNHRLRGTDSDNDAAFVKNLAAKYKLRYFEYQIESDKKIQGTLSENSARDLRYHFLLHQAELLGFRYLATAHTADDQTETVLHRILRGTGLVGLAGMTPVRVMSPAVTLLRPLLHVRRKEILAYLESHKLTFRQDKSNFENHYTRNRIRNMLLPMLRENFNPQIDEAFCRLANLAAEHESVLAELLDVLLEKAVVKRVPGQVVLSILPLQHCSPSVLRNILVRVWTQQHFSMREMDYSRWQILTELFYTEDKQLDFPGGISAKRTQNFFVLTSTPITHSPDGVC